RLLPLMLGREMSMSDLRTGTLATSTLRLLRRVSNHVYLNNSGDSGTPHAWRYDAALGKV
ncbi:MAG: hypothetical protein ACXV5G_11245, partial [Halobacteriota archaeon]